MIKRFGGLVGGHPSQQALMTGRAAMTNSYAVIPREVQRDIVASALPFWEKTRAWILARPLTGFAETFSQYVVDVEEGGGSTRPETEEGVESALFVLKGEVTANDEHKLRAGDFAYFPPDYPWTLRAEEAAQFTWIRKLYDAVPGLEAPSTPVYRRDEEVEAVAMPDTDGAWATTRFIDPDDMRHDMHVNIVSFKPGAVIPFKETHVMEHGILILQGKGVYHLNHDWVEVEAGDFLWLRAFCPQACYAGGPDDFKYLLYKDVNRHPRFFQQRRSSQHT
mmetsp:Transcript_7654/g.25165  ORF Transcript_7654/g.25165 Transcript_7654/m.25165 type:complete len:278 (-) Transcript_7654:84-917(-)